MLPRFPAKPPATPHAAISLHFARTATHDPRPGLHRVAHAAATRALHPPDNAALEQQLDATLEGPKKACGILWVKIFVALPCLFRPSWLALHSFHGRASLWATD